MHWSSICGVIPLCEQYLASKYLSKPEFNMVYLKTADYRKRLMCISDFMQLLNQYIARKANIEYTSKTLPFYLNPALLYPGAGLNGVNDRLEQLEKGDVQGERTC